MDHADRSIDQPDGQNFSPYKLISLAPEKVELNMVPSYRFVRGVVITHLIPLLALAFLLIVLFSFDLYDLKTSHKFYLGLLPLISLILATQPVCVRLEIMPGRIRRTIMNGFGTRQKEHSIGPGHRIEVRSTRGRARNWQFTLQGGDVPVTMFYIPSSTRLWFNLSQQEESKKNFMAMLSSRLHIPVVDADIPNA